MRGRFVLRYQGPTAPPDDIERIRELPGVVVVDQSPRMLLVESDADPLRELLDSVPGWVMAPEQTISIPDTRKKVVRPPEP